MRGAVIHAPGDIRSETLDDPQLLHPSTCQAEYVRIPNAQGTLVATDQTPDERFWPGLPAVSDPTSWVPAGGPRTPPR
jgi:hypothetical protein